MSNFAFVHPKFARYSRAGSVKPMRTLELVQPFLPHLNFEIFLVFLLGGKIKKNLNSQSR